VNSVHTGNGQYPKLKMYSYVLRTASFECMLLTE
jgi:hypothetical protein